MDSLHFYSKVDTLPEYTKMFVYTLGRRLVSYSHKCSSPNHLLPINCYRTLSMCLFNYLSRFTDLGLKLNTDSSSKPHVGCLRMEEG